MTLMTALLERSGYGLHLCPPGKLASAKSPWPLNAAATLRFPGEQRNLTVTKDRRTLFYRKCRAESMASLGDSWGSCPAWPSV